MLSGPMRPAPALAAEPRSRNAVTTGTVLGVYEYPVESSVPQHLHQVGIGKFP